MTILLQTRVSPELATRFKSAARAKGKSTYQVLRELAANYASQGPRRKFASEGYTDRFGLPAPFLGRAGQGSWEVEWRCRVKCVGAKRGRGGA